MTEPMVSERIRAAALDRVISAHHLVLTSRDVDVLHAAISSADTTLRVSERTGVPLNETWAALRAVTLAMGLPEAEWRHGLAAEFWREVGRIEGGLLTGTPLPPLTGTPLR